MTTDREAPLPGEPQPVDNSTTGRFTRADDDRFCDACGYDLGLHGTDEPDGYDCYIARQKADVLMMFGRAF